MFSDFFFFPLSLTPDDLHNTTTDVWSSLVTVNTKYYEGGDSTMERSNSTGDGKDPNQNNDNNSKNMNTSKKENSKKIDYGNENWNEAKKPLHWAR